MKASSVAGLSAAFGAGGAFFEAYIAARSSSIGQSLIALGAVWLGMVVGSITGMALYDVVFRKAIALHEFLLVSVLSIVVGCVAALYVPPPGWWAGILTIMAALLISTFMASLRKPRPTVRSDAP